MTALDDELDANREAFFLGWTVQASANWQTLKAHAALRDSYRRIAAFGALRREAVQEVVIGAAGAFLNEAHNDALTSHVLASTGAWRAALQSLRGCVENTLSGLYYADHPVELKLWAAGQHKIGFTEMYKYFESHPDVADVAAAQNGLEQLKTEYATLSKAVHGSTVDFRMTDDVSKVLLWSTVGAKASMWGTRERKVLEGLALLMTFLYRSQLQGARLTHVREMMKYIVSTPKRPGLREVAKVNV